MQSRCSMFRCLGLFSFYIWQHQDIQHIRHRSIEAPLNQWQFRGGELNMEDLKNLIAAADTAVKEGRKLSNKFLIDLFRALRKSKVTVYDMSGVKNPTICLALWFVSQSRVFTLLWLVDSAARYYSEIRLSGDTVWSCLWHWRYHRY